MLPVKSIIFTFSLVLYLLSLHSQQEAENSGSGYRIVFYNVENYFDTFEDSTNTYNEFTPEGDRHWTYSRYHQKRNRIYKVITALGRWESAAIVAFAELENRFVLEDLIDNTPLKNYNYQVVHHESGDHRGIDVGLIYDPDKVTLLSSRPIRLLTDDDSEIETRDILYAKCLIAEDTLHLFINHWPSRYGGMLQSAPLRKLAAKSLKAVSDSICIADKNPNILIMGDFNDDPDDESIQILTNHEEGCRLYNLALFASNTQVKGTLKYQADWNTFDQVIISANMLTNANSMAVQNGTGYIFDAAFLLEPDEKHLGIKPKRTYIGYRYNGGFSDHLPVFVDIVVTE